MQQLHISHSMYSFLCNKSTESRIANIIARVRSKKYHINNNIFDSNNGVNYLTNRKDGTMSYLPFGKEHHITESGEWAKQNRQDGKPSKVIRKVFSDKFLKRCLNDTDFEIFANLYKSEFLEEDYTFELLDKSRIVEVYNYEIIEGDGSLQGSCMNGDGGYLAMYTNCAKLQILGLFDTKKRLLVGRALVWDVGEGIFLMDRIYITKDYQYQSFLNYAKSKGWHHKLEYKSYNNKMTFVDSDGNIYEKSYTINTPTDFQYYPYIDTFSYGSDGSLSNYKGGGNCYEYCQTGGTREGDCIEDEDEDEDEDEEEQVECAYTGICMDESYTTYVRNIRGYDLQYSDVYIADRYVISANIGGGRHDVCSEDCNIHYVRGNYYHTDDLIYVESSDEYYLTEDVVYIESKSEYYLTEDCVEIESGEWQLSVDCIEIESGEWHLTEDCTETESSGWQLSVDCIEIDGLVVYTLSPEYKLYLKIKRRERRNKLGRKHTKKAKL